MYLKKLELNGFKSFADKTTLKILPGITSIVGPNGCGKTNIVDAISWVLGEQRIRLLRGYKMEDVIFNGTSGRSPVGMAEVTLTFDNSDGRLPIDYSEVAISRRLYRSGESGYFINRQPCRLRDINDLLLGTGLGARAYALVGQGRIDQILQSRPEERRELLEEAAQVSRFRKKKEEALRKLEQTQANLLRLEDIMKEVKRQLSIAERQARQAERYRQYRDRLRELELRAGALELNELRRRTQELGEEKKLSREKYGALERELEAVEQELSELRLRRRERGDALAAGRGELIERRAEIDKKRHRIELNAERGGELKHERERLTEEIARLTESRAAGLKEVEELSRRREELAAAARELTGSRREKEERLESLRTSRAGVEKELAVLQSRSLESSRREGHLRNELLGLQAGGKERTLRKRKLEVEGERIAEETAELRAEIERQDPRLAEAESELAALREAGEKKKSASGERESEARTLRERKEKILVSMSERESRRRLLLDREDEEPGSAAGLLLAAAGRPGSGVEGVIGRLEDFISIKPGSEQAIRSALGEKIRAVIVADGPAALAAIEFLKSREAGPVRILVLDWLRRFARDHGPDASPLRNDLTLREPLAGLEGVLLDGFSRSAELSSWAKKSEFLPAARLVGADGTALLPPGVVFWPGKEDPAAGFNLEEIENELSGLAAELAEIEAAETRCAAALRESREEAERAVGELHQREMAAALSRNEQERRRQALRKLELNREAIAAEIAALGEEERNSSGRLRQLELELKDCPSPGQVEESKIESLRESLAGQNAELRSLEGEVTELKIAQASSREREESVAQRLGRLEVESRERAELLASRSRRIEEDREREAALREETARLKEEIAGLEKLVEEGRVALAAREEEIEGLNRQCEEQEAAVRKIRPRFQEVQESLGSQDVSLAELRIKEQEINRRIREKYHLELDELEPPAGDTDREALLAEVEGLQEKMERMTNVNLAALEEKDSYHERFTHLTEQHADLQAAARDIEEAIAKINVTAREKLQTTYDIVRGHFQELFCRLFGGGKADLILDNEKDILESGLDIIAQPPGKKLSHISLLSGGERALTTIALIFALFKVQPSPFYILDEIDAPLDEANIGRFTALLKDLISDAQFIIITHNKRSISEADILYGITMEESGVSKVVSVRLASHDGDKTGEEE